MHHEPNHESQTGPEPADNQPPTPEQPADRPRIWVGSWLDYNNAILHGQWIDADREEADVWTDIRAMLAASPTSRNTGQVAEEWGIFDFEGFGAFRLDEQENLEVRHPHGQWHRRARPGLCRLQRGHGRRPRCPGRLRRRLPRRVRLAGGIRRATGR